MKNVILLFCGIALILIGNVFAKWETYYFGNNEVPHSAMEFGADVLSLMITLTGVFVFFFAFRQLKRN